MMESKNLARGLGLLEMGRFQEAIPFFQRAISEDRNDWSAKYYLALCLVDTGQLDAAWTLAGTLQGETPDNADVFFLKARIAALQDREKAAGKLIAQTLALDPTASDHWGFKAGLLLQEKRFQQALEAVNEGLRLDPSNTYCLNLRAQILTKMERFEEANETVSELLYEDPENSYSHANVGWVALENGQRQKALDHFKQALLLDPNLEYAREGMTTALKSKNLLYRSYLKYAFWIDKKSATNQWAIIIGLFITYRVLLIILDAEGLGLVAIPLMGVYLLFALAGWIMEPLSNAILNLDHYGKFLLAPAERNSGYMFTALLLLGLGGLALYSFGRINLALPLGITFICTLLPLPRAFLAHRKKWAHTGRCLWRTNAAHGHGGALVGFRFYGRLDCFWNDGPLYVDW